MNMENKIFKKIIKRLKSVGLQNDEKTFLRKQLLHFMEEHPVLIKSPYSIKSPYISKKLVTKLFRPAKVLATALIIVLVMGGSFAYAAESSLPGQILYPIKINIEEIKSLSLITSKQKVEWEIERTSRRLGEAAELSIQDKMNSIAREEIKTQIDKHTKKISQGIKEIGAENPESALAMNSQLESYLNAHGDMLTALKEKTEANGDITEIILKTQEKVAIVVEEMKESEELISEDSSPEKKLVVEEKIKKVEEQIDKMQNTIDNLEIPVSKSLINNIDERFVKIVELQEQVKKDIGIEEYGKVSVALQEIYQESEELDLLISLKEEFGVIDVEAKEDEFSTEEPKVEELLIEKVELIEEVKEESVVKEEENIEVDLVSLKELVENIENNIEEIKVLSEEKEAPIFVEDESEVPASEASIGEEIIIPNTEVEIQIETPSEDPGEIIKLDGEVVCLPHKETGDFQTFECALGLFNKVDGNYYGLKINDLDLLTSLPTGQDVQISGFVAEAGVDNKYNIVGIIEVKSITLFADQININEEQG